MMIKKGDLDEKIILTLVFIAIGLAGCNRQPENNSQNAASLSSKAGSSMGETGSFNSRKIPQHVSAPPDETTIATPKQIQEKQKYYDSAVKELKDGKVTEISFSYSFSPVKELTIRDEKLIQRWLSLIAEMEIEARTYEEVVGHGYLVSFKTAGKEIFSAGWSLPCIYGKYGDPTMLYVCNYKLFFSKIEQLEKDIEISLS